MPRSSSTAERPARAVTAEQRPQQNNAALVLQRVNTEIDNRMSIISASAAAGIRPERLKLVALTAFTRQPKLLSCDPISVARAIVEAGQLGLEPTGIMGGAYLVPRGGVATLLVGYRGLVMLAMRSQLVQRVEARVVRAKDTFDYAYGLEPYLVHKPSQDADPGAYTGAYAVMFYRDGSRQFDYMSEAEIQAIRRRSSSPNDGPWVTDYAEMAKKTPLRRLMKMAPLTVEVAEAIDRLDPEVSEQPSVSVSRESEMRQQLQAELAREYGGEPERIAVTNNALVTAPSAGDQSQADAPAGHPAAAAEPQAVAEQAALSEPVAPAEGASPAPQSAPAACGASHEGLGVGPCVLPPDHVPPQEHEQANGVRWSQPRS